MPPSAFLSWVQETTFAGVPLGSLLIAVLAGVATYLGILLALSLLTGRARAWASQSHSGVARAMVDVLEGTSRFLMLASSAASNVDTAVQLNATRSTRASASSRASGTPS